MSRKRMKEYCFQRNFYWKVNHDIAVRHLDIRQAIIRDINKLNDCSSIRGSIFASTPYSAGLQLMFNKTIQFYWLKLIKIKCYCKSGYFRVWEFLHFDSSKYSWCGNIRNQISGILYSIIFYILRIYPRVDIFALIW